MNQQQEYRWKMDWLGKIEYASRKFNIIRFKTGESRKHVKGKVDAIFDYIEKNNSVSFLTEAMSWDGISVADVVIFDPEIRVPEVIEIVCSEKKESLARKRFHWERMGFVFTERIV